MRNNATPCFTKKRKKIFLTSILIICLLLFIVLIYKSNNTTIANAGSKEIHTETTETKLDNSGYLLLKDDPNADDASIVSENVNNLIKGTKKYPVRTDGKKVVYLTFDDGPSTTNTPKVLEILDKNNIKGTFFVMGKSLDANDTAKDLLKEIAKNGHAIGNHTYCHDYKYLYPNRTMNVNNVINDLNKNSELMKSILGNDFYTRTIRLPGGYWSWNGRQPLKDKMIELGLENIDWDALNGDAEGTKKDSQELFNHLKKSVNNLGEKADSIVVLMHDTYGKAETVKALPKIIDFFKSKGFEFRTIK
ncbi:polysaccharide deacetylase family protein [Clostridium sardiniense]|uniref:polysaccharide deacetylase family protein n=1 Tax=Clostridium sardiniense TaxID=29369 RepID=UPI00195EF20E|nr:polysaccharide deacetylase family protein [Clostridium sardiniense]MBM7835588.1 peptidoglycan/xylan/chitin deacetylase (PgdA/CDA1 family) [Clostridium sardiniense]